MNRAILVVLVFALAGAGLQWVEAAPPEGKGKGKLAQTQEEKVAKRSGSEKAEQAQAKGQERAAAASDNAGEKAARGKQKQAEKAAAEGHGQGKSAAGKANASAKQLAKFEENHQRRLAQLNRIKQLAVEKGNTQMAAKADELIAAENARYAAKVGRFEEKAAGVSPGRGRGEKAEPTAEADADEAAPLPEAPAQTTEQEEVTQ